LPLRHRDDAYIPEPAGVTFVLTDAAGDGVVCLATTAALEAAARECGVGSRDAAQIFLALRPAIIACASDKYDSTGAPGGIVRVEVADLLQPEVVEPGD
jgi:hypothetical protein